MPSPSTATERGRLTLPLAAVTHLYVGVLDQAELLLDLLELLLLPADVGLQDPCPLLQLVLDGLEHAELCRELGGKKEGGKNQSL